MSLHKEKYSCSEKQKTTYFMWMSRGLWNPMSPFASASPTMTANTLATDIYYTFYSFLLLGWLIELELTDGMIEMPVIPTWSSTL